MDTKSKSTNLARGVFSWICFLLVVFTVLIGGVYFAVTGISYGGAVFERLESASHVYSRALVGELRELETYKESASSFFQRLYYAARNKSAADNTEEQQDINRAATAGVQVYTSDNTVAIYNDSISKDNLYSITDHTKGTFLTSDSRWDAETLPTGFNYLFRYEQGLVTIYHGEDGALAQVFSSAEAGAFYADTLSYTLQDIAGDPADLSISFAVREEATSFYASNEIVGSARSYANQLLFQLSSFVIAVVLFFFILILSFLFRQDRKLFETYLAHGLKWIWIEVKLAAAAAWIVFSFLLANEGLFGFCLALCTLFFMLYLFGIDISHNRRIYRHNIIHTFLKVVLANKSGRRFEQLEYRKYMATVAVLMALLAITVVTNIAVTHTDFLYRWRDFSMPVFNISMAAAGIGTLVWFAFALREDLRDYGKLMQQVELMYNGNLDAVNTLPPTSALYDSAMQLNMIRDGIKIAVEDGIKSERTKVELITNVSHDIKTPLTSIITYVELLKAERDLPEHVRDYVNVIAQKSDRLRLMLQDIFDVSKAATGNITLANEYIRMDKLLTQTLADMETVLDESPLEWRMQVTETPCPVYADGQRMYRVFQNLIKNAAQYSLEGSRVYVSLETVQDNAVLTIQNITKQEISMDGEALTARFVRGDDSRTSSGSGLGLSIAKSFTEACGGTCRIHVQRDQFVAEISLPLRTPPEPEATDAPEDAEKEEANTPSTENTEA